MARRHVAASLVLVGALLLAIGLPLRQAHRATRPDAFGDHAVALLDRPVVRAALADAAVDAAAEAVGGTGPRVTAAVRAAIAPRAAAVIASPAFRRAWRASARAGLRVALDDRRRVVPFTVGDLATLTTDATGPLPAPVAGALRSAGDVRLVTLRRSRATAERTARAERISALGRPALLTGTVLLLVALVVTPVRRATALRCGLGVLVAGLTVIVVERVARALVTGAAAAGRDREVAGAAWDELLGGLRPDALVLVAAGFAVVVVAAAVGHLGAPRRPGHPVG